MAKVLFHIDLNAFFASAEELRHPEYKDKPLAVGSNGPRGVLSTCNYAAREKGIHSAMPTAQAKALCPELVVVDGDHAYYRQLSSQFFSLLREYCGQLEVLSIDECFLDVTETIRQFDRPLDLAVSIQQAVLDRLGLRCSIGVGPTRFLAKMASDMRKPMGITVLRKRDIPNKLYPLKLEDCIGIGKKTQVKLKEAGLETIGDLDLEENQAICSSIFMNSWPQIQAQIHGQSSDQLVFSTTRKSYSHSRTFANDIYTIEELLDQASALTRELAENMKNHRKKGSMISIVLRDGSFQNKVHSKRLSGMTNDYFVLFEAVRSLLDVYFEPIGYRHMGISVGSLSDEDQIVLQPTISEALKEQGDLLDVLNRKVEGKKLMKLSDLLKEKENQAEKPKEKTDHE